MSRYIYTDSFYNASLPTVFSEEFLKHAGYKYHVRVRHERMAGYIEPALVYPGRNRTIEPLEPKPLVAGLPQDGHHFAGFNAGPFKLQAQIPFIKINLGPKNYGKHHETVTIGKPGKPQS